MDGLVFARELMVTGLPHGSFLVATTVRGSPKGGTGEVRVKVLAAGAQ